jgi:hypothetical protein
MRLLGSSVAFRNNPFLKALAWAFLISIYFRGLSNMVVDIDLWHQMALIREAINLGYFPLRDSFAYTPTIFPSVHHEWGAGVIAYFLAIEFGASGIIILKYLLAFALAAFVLLCLKRRLLHIENALLIFPIGLMLMQEGFATVRPQMYSFGFFACLLWFLDLDRGGNRRWIAIWIPLYTIWVNIHGGFVVSFALLGGYWLEAIFKRRPQKHIILLCLAMLALIALTPYGLTYYQYLLRALLMPRLVSEWHPVWINLSLSQIIIFIFSLIFVIYSVKKIGIHNADGFPALMIFALASIFCRRLIFFYAIIWTVYVPGYLQRTPIDHIIQNISRMRAKLIGIFLAIITLVIFFRIISLHPWNLLVPSSKIENFGNHPIYPVGPVEYLSNEGFDGNLMVFFDWGAYVTWKLYPKVRVSIDSRYEVAYQDWQLIENVNFYKASKGWEDILFKYQTDLVLIKKDFQLSKEMNQQKTWKRIYDDNLFELYARPGLMLPVEDKTGYVFTGKFP